MAEQQTETKAALNGTPKKVAKKAAKKKTAKKKAAKGKTEDRKHISVSVLPRKSLESSLPVAKVIYDNFRDSSCPWDSLASLLKLGTSNNNFKYAVWSAEAYGIIIKTEDKNYKITETARKILSPTYPGEDREGKIKAIMSPTLFSRFYSEYNKHPIPEDKFFSNTLNVTFDVPLERIEEAKSILIANAEFASIIRSEPNNGARLLMLDGFFEANGTEKIKEIAKENESNDTNSLNLINNETEYDKICFVISPIGEEGSEWRKHSDMLLNHMIIPIAKEFDLTVVRADKIEKSGLITKQILEHLVSSAFCIADLSFNNPNVFYELGVRHMCQLPTIQIIKKGDKIPFDVSQGRTITIDLSDIYSVVDKVESAKRELRDHFLSLKNKKGDDGIEDNPIKIYLPSLKITLTKIQKVMASSIPLDLSKN